MADYYIKQGDTFPPVEAQLLDANFVAIDITGATVTINIKQRGTLLFSRECNITDGANGWVRYDWQPGDTDTSGSATMDFTVTFPDGTITSFPDDRQLDVQITKNLTS